MFESFPLAIPGADNPYFSAGFGLGILGSGLAALRGSAKMAATLAQRHLLVTLEVTSKDKAYPWVLQWLTAQARRGGATAAQHMTVDTVAQRLANGQVETRFEFTPSPGRHVLWHEGQLLLVDRVREQATVDLHTGQPWECVKLTAFGRSRELFRKLLLEAQAAAMAKQELTTVVYTNWGTEWRPFGVPRRRRPLHSVVLDDGVAEHLVGDVREFVDSSRWYIDRGIPYRRGYLLHGAPGCGKSSFVAALAGELGYDICILNLSDAGLTDDRLAHALSTTPPMALVRQDDANQTSRAPACPGPCHYLCPYPHCPSTSGVPLAVQVLLEDVDAAFVKREAGDRRATHVTFSGLLNALDGVAAGEERILFMTTNHLERLDPALIRPGRVDVIHEVGPATRSQARRMFLKFFPTEEAHADAFARTLEGVDLSMAVLQSFFMLHRARADEAVAAADDLRTGAQGAARQGVPMQQLMAERAVRKATAAAAGSRGAGSDAGSSAGGAGGEPTGATVAASSTPPGVWDGDVTSLGCVPVPAGSTRLRLPGAR